MGRTSHASFPAGMTNRGRREEGGRGTTVVASTEGSRRARKSGAGGFQALRARFQAPEEFRRVVEPCTTCLCGRLQ
jgi:hypothetical protein